MRPFLPKRSSSAAASSRPKMVPTQQPAKATLGQTPPTEVPGPRPKIVLDPALREYSWLMRQEEERAKSRCSQTAPQKASVMPPSPRSVPGCWRQSVCEKYCCEHRVLSHSAHTANRCYREKNKTQTYSKREHLSSSPLSRASGPL